MKAKTLSILALLFAVSSYATLMLNVTHTGYLCPGGHQWPHGSVSNNLSHLSAVLVRYTVADGYVIIDNSPLSKPAWTSTATVLNITESNIGTNSPVYYLSLLPTYQDSCAAHENQWLSSRLRSTLVDVSGQTIIRTNDIYMVGSNSTPFVDFPDFGAVGYDCQNTFWPMTMFITNSAPDAIFVQRLIDGRWYGPQNPYQWLKNYENNLKTSLTNGSIRMEKLTSSDMVFGLWGSTNLTSWSYISNIVSDEWGYIDTIIGQATGEKKFYQILYTNSP